MSIPEISRRDIKNWIDERSYERGMAYFQSDAISITRRIGNTIKANCSGSYMPYYRVEITFDEEGICSGDCSCPVGAGGHCKHAAALLLTWLAVPEQFAEAEAVSTSLESMSQADLIQLILQMIDRYPDLERLVELSLLQDQNLENELHKETIRRQVEAVYSQNEYEWGWAQNIANDIRPVIRIANGYCDRTNYAQATMVYQTIIEVILEHDEVIWEDQDGDLFDIADTCILGLETCLRHIETPSLRKNIFWTLFSMDAWDTKAGGIDFGWRAADILVQQSNPEEKQQFSKWVEAELSTDQSLSDSFRNQTFGGLLLRLQANQMNDEAYLTICRQTGRTQDLVTRLLKLHRLEEAIAATQGTSDFYLILLADIFVEHEYEDIAYRFVYKRATNNGGDRLISWLNEHARSRDDYLQLVGLARRNFETQPHYRVYMELKDIAQKANVWTEERAKALGYLEEKAEFALLTEIFVEEKDVDRALDALRKAQQTKQRWNYQSLKSKVADVAGQTHPREAIRLYLEIAENLINRRGRDNYAQSTTYLARVKDLYTSLGEPQNWENVIAELRENYKKLPALQDELNKARL